MLNLQGRWFLFTENLAKLIILMWVYAGLKGTPFSELLKASTDLRTSGFSSILMAARTFLISL